MRTRIEQDTLVLQSFGQLCPDCPDDENSLKISKHSDPCRNLGRLKLQRLLVTIYHLTVDSSS